MPLSYRDTSAPAAEPVTLLAAKQHLRVDFDEDDFYISAFITAARQYVEKYTNRAIFNRKMILTLDYFPWPGWGDTATSTAYDGYMQSYYRGLTIRLPKPATFSVESLTYLSNDAVTVLTIAPSNYVVDLISEPARISPAPGFTWPYQQNYLPGQVKVSFTAGSYELAITETIVVPATAPYDVTLAQAANLITLSSVTDASEAPVTAYDNSLGTLSFTETQAGQTLTVDYTYSVCPMTIVAAMLLVIGHLYEHRSENSEVALKTIPLGLEYLLAGELIDSFDW
jgi:Phage gp6-like head-tail connector protein